MADESLFVLQKNAFYETKAFQAMMRSKSR